MSAGSGDAGQSIGCRQNVECDAGATRPTDPGRVPCGSEQHEQKWQFGAHWPPETSVGQLSSQDASPQIADRPLTLNVSNAKKTISKPARISVTFAWNPSGVSPPRRLAMSGGAAFQTAATCRTTTACNRCPRFGSGRAFVRGAGGRKELHRAPHDCLRRSAKDSHHLPSESLPIENRIP
jgi:hypothetical protein